MNKLAAFAAFVRQQKLEEYADEELKLVESREIPIMKLFTHLTPEQLRAQTIQGLQTFLASLENGTALQIAEESLRLWEADQLPGVPKNAIHPSDLVQLYYVQKVSLIHFIPSFTDNVSESIEIIKELEDYYSQVQDNAVQLLFRMQKEAEEETRLREKQLNEAQEIAMIGSFDWNIHENKAECSPELYRIYGQNPNEVSFSMDLFSTIMHQDDKEKLNEDVTRSIKNKTPYEREYRIILPEGRTKHLLARGRPIMDENDNVVRIVGTVQDISRQKDAEKKITQKTQELQQSNADLQRFASIASHDLKEPLRKIHTFADLLVETTSEQLDEENRNYLERIIGSCKRMEKVIDDLLTFSRLGIQKEISPALDLNQVIRDILDDFEVAINQNKATINVSDLPEINADASQMRQLFQNLIANALKFRKEDISPVINIRSEIQGQFCHITVEDNGIGFDEKYKEKIFEVFQRLHSKDRYEGTGIGLSICKRIVEIHKGSIDVHSRLNEGTTFIITLPLKGEIR